MAYIGGKLRDTITVRGTKTASVSYPASQHGGSVSVSIDYCDYVNIDVTATVASDPFENSVDGCKGEVSQLSAAVVATELAEVEAKRLNSQRVATSLIDGFFGYIRSDISQQVAQLKVKAESILMHLLKLGEQLVAKQHQMQNDYMRIRDRYENTFRELDKEMDTRIRHTDRPAFELNARATDLSLRSHADTLLNTVTVFGGENSRVQSMIYGSGLKMRSLKVLESANEFLAESFHLKRDIESILSDEAEDSTIFAPVLLVEMNDDNNGTFSGVYHSPLTDQRTDGVQTAIDNQLETTNRPVTEISNENRKMIGNYLQEEIGKNLSANNPYEERMIRMIHKFWRNSSVKVYSN